MFPQLGIPVPPTRDDEDRAAARKFMASVSRREIMSVNEPGAGRQFRSGSPPGSRNTGADNGLSVHQQARLPAPMERPSGNGPQPRWQATAKGAEHDERVALRKLKGIKYTAEELKQKLQFYLEHNDRTLREKDGFRWQTLIELKDAVKQVAPDVPLAGRDNAVYEQLFKASPKQHITKPRFFVAMRKVFGFDIANTTEASDGKLLLILERVYKSFDSYDRGEFDWRLFLVMLRVVSMPLVAFRDQLMFGFGVFASSGSFDGGGQVQTSQTSLPNKGGSRSLAVSEEVSDGVRYGDIRDMFSALTTEPLRALLLDLVESSWLELAELSTSLNVKVVSALRSGKPSNAIKLSRTQFDRLLDMPSLAPLFEAGLPMGTHDPEVWTLVLEEHFAEPGLLAYIKPYRREVHASRKAKAFLSQYLTRTRRRCCATWKRYCHRRQRARFLVAHCIVRWRIANGLVAFGKWRRHTLLSCSAVVAQRYVRGWMGRLARWYLVEMERVAVRLQTYYRAMRAKRHYHEFLIKRHWAACEMQRRARGNEARRLALYKLETKLWRERKALAKDRYEFEHKEELRAAVVLQNAFRGHKARAAAAKEAKQRAAEKEVERMREALEADFTHKRNVYRKELEQWFKEQKRAGVEGEAGALQQSKREVDIARHRRVEAALEHKKGLEEKRVKKEAEKDAKVEAWLLEWGGKAQAAYDLLSSKLEKTLNHPTSAEEEKERKGLLKEVKAQARDVLARAEKAGLRMEQFESEQIAAREVIGMHCDAAKEEVEGAMRREALRVEKEEAELEEKAKRFEERTEYLLQSTAVQVVQRSWRRWMGRRLLRRRLYECYEKRLLGDTQGKTNKFGFGFEYLDLRTDELSSKPLLLGKFDLFMENVWRACFDQHGGNYYYNGGTMAMQWEAPHGTVRCEVCQVDFARRWELVQEAEPASKATALGKFIPQNARRVSQQRGGGARSVKKAELGRMLCVPCWEEERPFDDDVDDGDDDDPEGGEVGGKTSNTSEDESGDKGKKKKSKRKGKKDHNTFSERVGKHQWVGMEGGSEECAQLVESGALLEPLTAKKGASKPNTPLAARRSSTPSQRHQTGGHGGENEVVQSEMKLGINYCREKFWSDESDASAKLFVKVEQASAHKARMVRLRMMKATNLFPTPNNNKAGQKQPTTLGGGGDDQPLPLPQEVLAENEFVREQQLLLRKSEKRLNKDRREPFDADSTTRGGGGHLTHDDSSTIATSLQGGSQSNKVDGGSLVDDDDDDEDNSNDYYDEFVYGPGEDGGGVSANIEDGKGHGGAGGDAGGGGGGGGGGGAAAEAWSSSQWSEYVDDETGLPYWYNEFTAEYQYEPPAGFDQDNSLSLASPSASSSALASGSASALSSPITVFSGGGDGEESFASSYPSPSAGAGPGGDIDGDGTWGSGGGSEEGGGGQWCSECGEAWAERLCQGCGAGWPGGGRPYCAECFNDVHRKDPSKREHAFQNVRRP